MDVAPGEYDRNWNWGSEGEPPGTWTMASKRCWGAMFVVLGVPVREIGLSLWSEEVGGCVGGRFDVSGNAAGREACFAGSAGEPCGRLVSCEATETWTSVSTFFFFLPSCPLALTRFRDLITSVLRLIGRGRPCNFRKSPHALQRTLPLSSRRQSAKLS